MAESTPENPKEKENEPEVKTEAKSEPRILQTDDKFPLRGLVFHFINFHIVYIYFIFLISETRSSLPLQMALHFHIHIDPIIYIAAIGCLIIKVSSTQGLYINLLFDQWSHTKFSVR